MKLTNKRLVGGLIALLAIVSVVQTQAIIKIAKSKNQSNLSQTIVKNSSVSQSIEIPTNNIIDDLDLVAQISSSRGEGSCSGTIDISTIGLPSYVLNDGDNTANVFKFRVKNNNTLPSCIVNFTGFDFINLNFTNANRNFEKIYLMDSLTNTPIQEQQGFSRLRPSINGEFITTRPEALTVAPGQFKDLYLRAEYIRNTNINEEEGYDPAPEDYFIIGLSRVTADINGTPANMSLVPARFDKKPIMVD